MINILDHVPLWGPNHYDLIIMKYVQIDNLISGIREYLAFNKSGVLANVDVEFEPTTNQILKCLDSIIRNKSFIDADSTQDQEFQARLEALKSKYVNII